MFKNILLVVVLVLSFISFAASYGETQVTVGYWAGNSNCYKKASPPQNNVTYIFNQCYDGKKYSCDQGHVSYDIYPTLDCAGSYPKAYGLPGNMCLSPVYAYSSMDTYFWCH